MAQKKTKVKTILNSTIKKITQNLDIEELILFGSHAKGNPNDLSDIDLAVISQDLNPRLPIFDNNLHIKRTCNVHHPDLQLISLHPSKFYNPNSFIDPGFIQEIKRTGKVIYSKQKGLDLSFLD